MKRAEGQRGIRYLIGVDSGKEAIMYATTLTDAGARFMHFPLERERGYDIEFFRGLCSERMVAHRKAGQTVMQWTKIYERNEPLDCRNYARAAYKNFRWNFQKYERMISGDDDENKPITQEQARKRRHNPIVSRGIRI
jgi:phage terminase large subunit GpA-like protein